MRSESHTLPDLIVAETDEQLPRLALRRETLAKSLDCSVRTIDNLKAHDGLPFAKLRSGIVVFPVDQVRQWLADRARPTAEQASKETEDGDDGQYHLATNDSTSPLPGLRKGGLCRCRPTRSASGVPLPLSEER